MKTHAVTIKKNVVYPLALAPHVYYTIYCSCGYSDTTSTGSQSEVDRVILEHKLDVLLDAARMQFVVSELEPSNIGR